MNGIIHIAQVGGDHYEAAIQHWDMVARTKTEYFLGNATKYLGRYDRKGKPIEDIDKALSYVQKARVLNEQKLWYNTSEFSKTLPVAGTAASWLRAWFGAAGITDQLQQEVIFNVLSIVTPDDFYGAEMLILRLRKRALEGLVPLGASGVAPTPTKAPSGAAAGQGGGVTMGGPTPTLGNVNHPAPFGYQEE